MQLVSCLKNNIKIYIKTSPTCFGVTVTPSSGSASILLQLLNLSTKIHRCVFNTVVLRLHILSTYWCLYVARINALPDDDVTVTPKCVGTVLM